MEIIIPLPQADNGVNTYKELQAYLKQLELAVHHAQKAVESAEKNGIELTEDCFIDFEHPSINGGEKIEDMTFNDFATNCYAELQNIELRINLA